MHICHFICYFSYVLKCGEWPYLFATIVANENILLDIAVLNTSNLKRKYQGGVEKVPKQFHILFEWLVSVNYFDRWLLFF